MITELSVGGAQEYALLAVEGLNRNKYEVHLGSSPGGEWESRASKVADRLIIIPNLRRGINPYYDAIVLFQLIKLIKKEKYHIIHTHSSKAGFLGRIAGRVAKAPIIIHTIHGFSFHQFMNPFIKQLYALLEKVSARLSDILITVSEINRQEGINIAIAPKEKFITIYNGFALEKFQINIDKKAKKRELGFNPELPLVGMVGRLAPQKAPQIFTLAAMKILNKYPNVQFALVGDGPLQGEIRSMINNDHRIKLFGNRDDVPEILHTLDIFALPSLWEGLPRSIVEAMICSLPIVATPAVGTLEVIEHNVTGLLVPYNDPDALADSIVYLLNNPSIACQLGENARERVIPKFSLELMIKKMEELYDWLVQKKRVISE
ncbi:MAG: glycosyltransferase family 4 protein [Nitrospirae bacterium]|nr:glycosyltransferase family 4 protein [Nitrospirota bacterium]